MGEPGVRVLGIVLCDQTLVGVVLQGGVGGAVGSLGGEFHYTVRLFVQPRGFLISLHRPTRRWQVLGLQANTKD
jgi:hypothetical protein